MIYAPCENNFNVSERIFSDQILIPSRFEPNKIDWNVRGAGNIGSIVVLWEHCRCIITLPNSLAI